MQPSAENHIYFLIECTNHLIPFHREFGQCIFQPLPREFWIVWAGKNNIGIVFAVPASTRASDTYACAMTCRRSLRSCDLGTTSPRDCFVFPTRERICRVVRAEQRNAHHLAGAILDRLRARVSIQVCLGEGWGANADLDRGVLQFDHHGERHGVHSRLGRRVNGAERLVVRGAGVSVRCQRANAARYVDDVSCWRLAQERQHRLVNGEDTEHVGLPNRAHFIEGRVARAGYLSVLLEGHAALSCIRDGRVLDEYVEAAKLLADALCRGGDRSPIRHVELERNGARPNLPSRSLAALEDCATRPVQ